MEKYVIKFLTPFPENILRKICLWLNEPFIMAIDPLDGKLKLYDAVFGFHIQEMHDTYYGMPSEYNIIECPL